MSEPYLVYDRRAELGPAPGTHALVIGVSEYRHLPERAGAGDPARTFGLTRLTTAARSASVFKHWLTNNADRLVIPLKTVRLVLVPDPTEQSEITNFDDLVRRCDFDDFVSAVYAWRDDAAQNVGDATLFYFCGNGFDIGPSDPVIALGDFGAPNRPVLSGTVSVSHLIQGMAPSSWQPGIARTQLYFIDAGRRRQSFENAWRVAPPPLFDLPLPSLDDRKMITCHASSPGERAWAVLGGTTLFLKALVRCLQGEAAVLGAGQMSQPTWEVTINSLAQALPGAVARVSAAANAPEQQVFVVSKSGDAALVRLTEPPLVPVTVAFGSPGAAERAVFDIRTADNRPAAFSPPTLARGGRTRELQLAAGVYLVHVKFRPEGGGEPAGGAPFFALLNPPGVAWSVGEPS